MSHWLACILYVDALYGFCFFFRNMTFPICVGVDGKLSSFVSQLWGYSSYACESLIYVSLSVLANNMKGSFVLNFLMISALQYMITHDCV